MSDVAALGVAEQNGAAMRLGDDDLIKSIEAQALALRARAEILRAELDEIEPHLARYEKSIKVLRGEPLTGTKGQGKPRAGRPSADDADRVRAKPSKLSPERLEAVREAVLGYAEDHEEFRQVDIRGLLEGSVANSSTMALAFEALRQDGTIRFARQEGNAKWFRLTNAATQSATREALVGAERMIEVEQVVRELGAEGEPFGYDVVTERTGLSHSGASYAMGELVRRGVLDEGRATGRGGAKLFSLAEAVEA